MIWLSNHKTQILMPKQSMQISMVILSGWPTLMSCLGWCPFSCLGEMFFFQGSCFPETENGWTWNPNITGWWFQICFIWGSDPIWLYIYNMFQRGWFNHQVVMMRWFNPPITREYDAWCLGASFTVREKNANTCNKNRSYSPIPSMYGIFTDIYHKINQM